LQGMPKWFRLRGTFSKQVEQVSNAVPLLGSRTRKALYHSLYAPIRHIQNDLLNWFDNNQRSFPWRETTDPYRILVAEKLLQQTSATQNVVSAFNEITTRYPKIEDLAEADVRLVRGNYHSAGFHVTEQTNLLNSLAAYDPHTRASSLPNSTYLWSFRASGIIRLALCCLSAMARTPQ